MKRMMQPYAGFSSHQLESDGCGVRGGLTAQSAHDSLVSPRQYPLEHANEVALQMAFSGHGRQLSGPNVFLYVAVGHAPHCHPV